MSAQTHPQHRWPGIAMPSTPHKICLPLKIRHPPLKIHRPPLKIHRPPLKIRLPCKTWPRLKIFRIHKNHPILEIWPLQKILPAQSLQQLRRIRSQRTENSIQLRVKRTSRGTRLRLGRTGALRATRGPILPTDLPTITIILILVTKSTRGEIENIFPARKKLTRTCYSWKDLRRRSPKLRWKF